MQIVILDSLEGFTLVDEHDDCVGKILINPLMNLEKRIDVKEAIKYRLEKK